MKKKIKSNFDLVNQQLEHKKEQLGLIINTVETIKKNKKDDKFLNRQRYKQLREIVGDEKFFKMEHIKKLNLDFDILILLGRKNIGKTKEIYKIFNDVIKAKEKLIYMRYSLEDLEHTEFEFNEVSERQSPIILERRRHLYHLLDRVTGDMMGLAVEYKKCQKIGGPEYPDYFTVIFDECIPYTIRKESTLKYIQNWGAFFSSLTRNKRRPVKFYLFGNLIDGPKEILDFFQIDEAENLEYIRRGERDGIESNILFINTTDIYPGIEEQVGSVRAMSPIVYDMFVNNALSIFKNNVIDKGLFFGLPIVFSFLFEVGPEVYFIQLRKAETVSEMVSVNRNIIYAIRCLKYDIFSAPDIVVFSDSAHIISQYFDIRYTPTIEPFLSQIFYLIKLQKMVYFDAGESMIISKRIYDLIAKDKKLIC